MPGGGRSFQYAPAGVSGGIFESGAVGSVILRCRHLGTSLQWYRETLGWAPVASSDDGGERYATFSVGGILVSLWELPQGEQPARAGIRGQHVAIFVHDDLDALRRRLIERGIVAEEVIEAERYRSFRFDDPDGNVFAVTTAVGGLPPALA